MPCKFPCQVVVISHDLHLVVAHMLASCCILHTLCSQLMNVLWTHNTVRVSFLLFYWSLKAEKSSFTDEPGELHDSPCLPLRPAPEYQTNWDKWFVSRLLFEFSLCVPPTHEEAFLECPTNIGRCIVRMTCDSVQVMASLTMCVQGNHATYGRILGGILMHYGWYVVRPNT